MFHICKDVSYFPLCNWNVEINSTHVKNIPLGDEIFDTKILASQFWGLLRRVDSPPT
jgi:hypothetical protein